jgi:(p)ppGpp synthase/HD superfamily hydrolase
MKGRRVFEAIEFAARAHAGQFRKGTELPYILHPLGAARILIERGCPEDVVVAAVLHDTLEDTPVQPDEIRSRFGEAVAALVAGASEPDRSDTWENRKRHTLALLKEAPVELLLVSVADKLDNIRAIAADLSRHGEAIWSRFNRQRKEQEWYYRSLADAFASRAAAAGEPAAALFREFEAEVLKVFGSPRQRNTEG